MMGPRETEPGSCRGIGLFRSADVRCLPVRAVPLAAVIRSRVPGRGRGAWGGPRQHGRVHPQQRPIRGNRQQHTASQARGPRHQLQSDQRPLGHTGSPQCGRSAMAASPYGVAHTPTLHSCDDPCQGRKSQPGSSSTCSRQLFGAIRTPEARPRQGRASRTNRQARPEGTHALCAIPPMTAVRCAAAF